MWTDKELKERARALWSNSEYNANAWFEAVKRLGDRWLLASPLRKEKKHE